MTQRSAVRLTRSLISICLLMFYVQYCVAQTTTFTYQGKLTEAGNSANGNYDLQFKLFDALSGGTQQGSTLTNSTVPVSNGIFTVTLDFGANVFSGANRWLEIGVRPAGNVNPYTGLTPRQPITSIPYAIQTLKATSADALSNACVNCVQDAQINGVAGNKVSGAIPIAGVPAGSTNYIQNTATQQTSANFNIDGNALIGGNVGIGTVAPTDKLTVQTPSHSFGITHTDGIASIGTYVGAGSSGFGGWFGTRSNHPLFFFTGGGSAQMTLTPAGNIGIGTATPLSRLTISGSGGQPVLAGSRFDIFNTVFNGGFYQWVSNNGYWTLATSNDVERIVVTPTGNIGIGTPNANDKLTVQTATSGYGLTHTDGNITVGTFVGGLGGWYGTQSNHPLFFFTNNGNAQMTLTTAGNVGVGTITPQSRLHINGTSWFQGDTTPLTAAAGRGVATGMNNTGGYLFAYDYAAGVPLSLNLNGPGGNVSMGGSVSVSSNANIGGILSIQSYANGSPAFSLCATSSGQVTGCSSSLRYKTNVAEFSSGLALINQLRPVTFDWKADGQHDVGFIAEEVEKVHPLFVTYNAQGEIQGVKYERLSVAFVNAFKEQQAQIEQQKQQVNDLKNQMELMKQLVCAEHPQSKLCQSGENK